MDNLLDNHGFDLWADGYDKSVDLADDKGDYPFAGYRELMNTVFGTVVKGKPARVLDIGIGTGTLAAKLYERGIQITGIDFSKEMLNIAQLKMPGAELITHDFSKGLPESLENSRFDFIVSTYALHHLTDDEKTPFILSLFDFLEENGTIIIGDISFLTRDDLEKCKKECGNGWDDDEHYFIFPEIKKALNNRCILSYRQFSHCAGVMEIVRRIGVTACN